MRLPRITKYDSSIEKETVNLKQIEYGRKYYDLDNDKDRFKFISTVERICRSSMEYKQLIEFLKVNMNMNFCSFFHNVSRNINGTAKVRIEIHHEPFTLYDIVAIILNNRIENEKYISIFDIADEVMEVHYKGYVGLVPLSETVHELVHNGKIFIPLQFIDEGFNLFYRKYKKTIDNMDGLCDLLQAKVRLSQEYAKNPDEFISILKKRYIYILNEGYEPLKRV